MLQWLKCEINNKTFALMNVHGLWNGLGKTDSDDRLIQSEKIRHLVDTISTPKILCGDFNLRPDTQSFSILKHGMKDLIGQYGITSTRTQLYEKEEKYADYILTSPEIDVIDFKVWDDVVSDHNPLSLEFTLDF
jgi:endonuclease/exonuclease/phosphatase family metal-dependent hydrolase